MACKKGIGENEKLDDLGFFVPLDVYFCIKTINKYK